MNGTYIREPDGANLLRYSASLYADDPMSAFRRYPEEFSVVLPEGNEWDKDVENEAQYLVPGEWLAIDGPLMVIGGAM